METTPVKIRTRRSSPTSSARGRATGSSRERGSASPGSEQQAKRRAAHREKDALGEKLTDHACSTGAECGTDGKFAGATGRARQQEIGDVHAGNEEHKANSGQQHQKKRLDGSDHFLLHRLQRGAFTGIGLGKSCGQVLRYRIHIRAGLGKSDARPEPAYGLHAQSIAAITEIGISPLANGNEDVLVIAEVWQGQVEIGWHHADDGVALAVQHDSAT